LVSEAPAGNPQHYRCVGIGVGPANLSLASLMYGSPELTNIFLERKASFGWHDGQQIPGASLQVSMLKDLVSLSDPTNAFSFLSYLHSLGRIHHFLNARFDAVPRQEFRNYLEWASSKNPNIVFGQQVESVEFDGVFRVRTNDQVITADHLSVGVGSQPWIPPQARADLDGRQFHVSEFVSEARDMAGLRVGVVGGGQSGAEAFLDLISRPSERLPRRVSWISRRPNFLPLDDSPFTNDYYMPCYSDHFATLDAEARRRFNTSHVLSSDGISEATLRQIYQKAYIHRFVDGSPDLIALFPNSEVTGVADGGANSPWDLTLTNNTQQHHIELDVIVWATGFRTARMDFLQPIEHRLEREGDEYKIDQSFAVQWDGPPDHHIFMQNAARQQRGLADANLSLLAWRSQRILDRLRGVRTEHQMASFIEWSVKPTDDDQLQGA
jgi:lysine N6-hydroxylase